jgi:hypothetical protein
MIFESLQRGCSLLAHLPVKGISFLLQGLFLPCTAPGGKALFWAFIEPVIALQKTGRMTLPALHRPWR